MRINRRPSPAASFGGIDSHVTDLPNSIRTLPLRSKSSPMVRSPGSGGFSISLTSAATSVL